MEFDYSKHATEQLKLRGIDFNIVKSVITKPDKIITDNQCKHIYQKVLKTGNKNYLYRIFVNVCDKPPLIITGYRTSKLKKY